MICPTDGTTLVLADRTGVEIDHCPVCRGVWLDRGELDKLIDRAAAPETTRPGPSRRRDQYDADDDDDRFRADGSNPSKRKRKSLLSNLLEFGG